MSARSRLLLQAEKGISNPFLLCTLISRRTRQLMMTRGAGTSTTQLVDFALDELIAGALKFEGIGERRAPLVAAEVHVEESNDHLASQRPRAASSAALPVEGP